MFVLTLIQYDIPVAVRHLLVQEAAVPCAQYAYVFWPLVLNLCELLKDRLDGIFLLHHLLNQQQQQQERHTRNSRNSQQQHTYNRMGQASKTPPRMWQSAKKARSTRGS